MKSLSLSRMNPHGVSLIMGSAGTGKSTLLRALCEEVYAIPGQPFVAYIDVDGDGVRPIYSRVSHYDDIFNLEGVLKVIRAAPGFVFIDGFGWLLTPGGKAIDCLAAVAQAAKENNVRVIVTVALRKGPSGAIPKSIEEDQVRLADVTDGFIFNLDQAG